MENFLDSFEGYGESTMCIVCVGEFNSREMQVENIWEVIGHSSYFVLSISGAVWVGKEEDIFSLNSNALCS